MRKFKNRARSAGLLILLLALVTTPMELSAQRMKHGGGGRSAATTRPSTGAPNRSRPSSPSTGQRPTINGGSQKSPDHGGANSNAKPKDRTAGRDGNTANIGSGNKNVNINVDNSRNTTVRRNTNVHYARPPYHYGGWNYYCFHPYFYHPYHPYYWGPVWHPWGFFVATLATTAIIISIENQQYHYDSGVYYVSSNGGYTVVQAPVGATVTTIPSNSETVIVNETTNNYYYGGTYYEKSGGGYTVVPPTAGTIVENLPEGGEEVKVGDQTYVKYGETYYQPIEKDGKSMYEVVNVEKSE